MTQATARTQHHGTPRDNWYLVVSRSCALVSSTQCDGQAITRMLRPPTVRPQPWDPSLGTRHKEMPRRAFGVPGDAWQAPLVDVRQRPIYVGARSPHAPQHRTIHSCTCSTARPWRPVCTGVGGGGKRDHTHQEQLSSAVTPVTTRLSREADSVERGLVERGRVEYCDVPAT